MLRQTLALGALAVVMTAWVSPIQAQELNWAEKMFSELKHDFGTVARGADTRATIVVTNIYEEDVSIGNVGTTCGCTAAKPDKNLLKTREQAQIEIKMNTVKFMRRKDSNVLVTLTFHGPQGSSTKEVKVPITAYIRSDVVITPEPGNADFGAVEFGAGAERKLEIAYAGRDNWNIKDVRVPNNNIEAGVKEVSRGPGRVSYELTVRLKPNAPLGSLHEQITLVTDDANAPEVPVLVMGKVEPDISVYPPSYTLGNLRPGESKTFQVVVKGKRPFTIAHIQCESADCFEVKQPTDEAKTVHIVPFKMTAPEKAGEFTEKFTFTIEGRPEPVMFQASGMIAAAGT
ncbi:DUF1573 domain-containing protein [Planctomicrobium piriforme]|nr:DUF1573 domain-containing protein [Planctomicrobium piriforme]